MDSNRTLSEKLQNIMDKCNEAEKCSNAERNQRFGKKLAVFKSTKARTNNISKPYEAIKSPPSTSAIAERDFCAIGLFITKLCMIRASMPFTF